MVYRKGEATKAAKLRDWPHHVRVEIPELGLGQRLNAMHDHCRARGINYQTTSIRGTSSDTDAMLWCFRAEEDAAAFREAFGIADEAHTRRHLKGAR